MTMITGLLAPLRYKEREDLTLIHMVFKALHLYSRVRMYFEAKVADAGNRNVQNNT